ncbi:sugar transferase [Lactobacillus hamsteri]|uniref:Sugar-transferase n=1 Tax=Lactobacillus hamsteri DSM 5661 = JCM 6256 TaxID=1423754 RepID=A0A0R1YL16_9LACO|nr:sugar transferase [Lactobacillus hamsteri]KRM39916.1 sugar-transferase [Lactobacillus hamsteri DSM 5661 = JCM 6256]
MLMMERVKLDKSKVQGRFIYHFFKRALDIVASACALIILFIPGMVLAFLIRHEDHGPSFYSQERIGKDGKPFKMYKFRSMIVNADQLVDQLEAQNEINGAMFKIKDDPRVTKIGHTIRKYSLDELPQLWNVLIGDMSLVGPRPPLPSEVEEYTDYDFQRLSVTPGCTGLWQVTKRNDANFDEMVELDLDYINHSGFWYDLEIIFKTIGVMIHPNGAY